MNVIRRHLLRARGKLPAQIIVSECFASTDAKHVPETPVYTPAWTPKGQETVRVMLGCYFDPATTPENTNPELYKQYFRRSEVYLIGTKHQDTKCISDVQTAIRRLRPDGIFLEQPDTEHGRSAVLIDFGWPDEFRIAYKEAKALKIPKNRVVLGDVPTEITRNRARFSGHEDEFNQYLDASIDSRFRSEKPTLYKALVTERDIFMTHGLMKMINEVAASEYTKPQRKGKAVRLIAVIGAGHIRGITRNWGRNISDEKIARLLMTREAERKRRLKKAAPWVVPLVTIILILLVAY